MDLIVEFSVWLEDEHDLVHINRIFLNSARPKYDQLAGTFPKNERLKRCDWITIAFKKVQHRRHHYLLP